MKVDLKRDKTINKIVSHQMGVTAAVHAEAMQIGARAEANLSGHHRTGSAHIEVEKGTKGVDSFVLLVDDEAAAIEFGHYNHWSGSWTNGLYIITRAAKNF